MQVEQNELVSDVFCEVLEKLAFMFGEAVEKEELASDTSEYIRAMMSFTGAMSGKLGLVVPKEMCPEIAANVLGMDPDDELVAAQAIDALKEVLNVVCGNVLTALAGERAMFDLSVPEISTLNAAEWTTTLHEPQTWAFLVDDIPVLLELST